VARWNIAAQHVVEPVAPENIEPSAGDTVGVSFDIDVGPVLELNQVGSLKVESHGLIRRFLEREPTAVVDRDETIFACWRVLQDRQVKCSPGLDEHVAQIDGLPVVVRSRCVDALRPAAGKATVGGRHEDAADCAHEGDNALDSRVLAGHQIAGHRDAGDRRERPKGQRCLSVSATFPACRRRPCRPAGCG
jgi:hypothetical protein